jgi:acetolactate synthase-1/2/3 large subunit
MLVHYGVDVVFGLPGDTSVDFYDALQAQRQTITHVMARDERSAAFMADVYSRLSGRPGICEGPSGGGATYMLPGIVEANGSSVALIALTTDNPVSYEVQGALTDLEQTEIYGPVTKWSALVKSPEVLPHFVRRAFRVATSGRPGAVHLALPKDVLDAEINGPCQMHTEDACKTWPAHRTRPAASSVSRAVVKLLDSKRPVIVAGGGVVSSGAFAELSAVSELLSAPVATTINGKGAMAETSPLSLGVIGANGGRPYAGRVVQEADLVLFIGSKVNYVDTDSWRLPPREAPPVILQIDVDPSEIGNNYPVAEGLCADAKAALADLLEGLQDAVKAPVDRAPWLGEIAAQKKAWARQVRGQVSESGSPLLPGQIVRELRETMPEETIYVSDPGTPTPFMSAEFEVRRPGRSVISPRAQGGLGYAIPGVVGARLARPETPVVGLCGDGSFAMSAGDLITIARVGGPTIVLHFRNNSYGWIKALQKLYHGERYYSVDFDEPLDYLQVARGFGLQGRRVSQADEIGPALREAVDSGGPFFIDMATAGEDEVTPPVAPWQRRLAEDEGRGS